MQKSAKKNAKIQLTASQKTSEILKTVASDIATTSGLGRGKRRIAHVLGMYGTILFWIVVFVVLYLVYYYVFSDWTSTSLYSGGNAINAKKIDAGNVTLVRI